MIVEALFLALPFSLGLWLSAERGARAFGSWLALEVFLFWLAAIAFRQPLLAAGLSVALLGTIAFVAGRWLGRRKKELQFGGLAGVALVAGMLVTATLGGALRAPVRQEKVRTARFSFEKDTWSTATRAGALASSRMLWLRLGMRDAPDCSLNAEGLDASTCTLGEERLVQRVVDWQPPRHLKVAVRENVSGALFNFTGVEYWLAGIDGQHVMRSTEYESKLVPAWLWRPLERRLVVAEHDEALGGAAGDARRADVTITGPRLALGTTALDAR